MIFVAGGLLFTAGFICALFLHSPTTDLDAPPARRVIDLKQTGSGSWGAS